MLSGAGCEHDDELETALALLMVLTAEQLDSKGHSGLPLLIQRTDRDARDVTWAADGSTTW